MGDRVAAAARQLRRAAAADPLARAAAGPGGGMKVLLAWAGLLALWTAVQLAFSPDPLTVILLGGSAAGVAALALVARAARARAEPAPDLSPATVLTALGVGALLSGTELGPWCLALGGLMTAAGIAGLIAERAR
jgi:hypothetical protein